MLSLCCCSNTLQLANPLAVPARSGCSYSNPLLTECNTMPCNAMQCNAMQCNAMQCNAMQCNTMPSLASISQSGPPHVYYAMCPVMTIAPIGHFVHSICSSRAQKNGHKTEQASATPASVCLSNAVPADKLNDQDCLFLGGVQLHLCCCNPEEQLQLVRIAREGCALRHTDLSPGLTHIVVRTLLRP